MNSRAMPAGSINDPRLHQYPIEHLLFARFMIHELEGLVDENHPLDRGGHTRYGVTAKELREEGIDIDKFDYVAAIEWFVTRYILIPRLHLIDDPQLRMRLFVDGVHIGSSMPVTHMQRILNAMNNRAKRWQEIDVDGVVGPQTTSVLRQYRRHNAMGDYELDKMFEMLRATTFNYYLDIMLNRPEQEVFFNGWVNRLNKTNLATVGELTEQFS